MVEFPEYELMTEETARKFMWNKERQKTRDVVASYVREVGGTVLDVGCGRGIEIKRLYNKDDYFGVDISPALVKIACEHNPEYRFVVADAQDLPFNDRTFDNVICQSVFEHLHKEEQVVRVIKELIRVCNKQLVIAWHVSPDGIEKSEINIVDVPFIGKIYQNKYRRSLFDGVITNVKVSKYYDQDDIHEWTLWIIRCD